MATTQTNASQTTTAAKAPAAKAPTPTAVTAEWHQLYTTILIEAIGVFLLSIIADSNEHLGSIIVVIMIGWFIVFLGTHGAEIPYFKDSFAVNSTALHNRGTL